MKLIKISEASQTKNKEEKFRIVLFSTHKENSDIETYFK